MIPALILIVIGVIGLTFTAKDYFALESGSGEQIYQANEIEEIHIHSNVANVEMKPSETNEIKVVWEGKWREGNEQEFTVDQDDDQLHMNFHKKGLFNRINFDFGFNSQELTIHIYVPKKQFRLIDVKNNVGLTRITSVKADEFIVYSDVGDVKVDRVHAASVDVTSSVGLITLKDVNAKIQANNDVGETVVLANEIYDNMSLTSNVGNVKVKVPQVLENVTFTGSSEIGSINIFGSKGSYISEQQSYVVVIETEIGNIDVLVD